MGPHFEVPIVPTASTYQQGKKSMFDMLQGIEAMRK